MLEKIKKIDFMPKLIGLIVLALPLYLIRFSIGGIPTTLLEILIYLVFVISFLKIRSRQKVPKIWLLIAVLFLLAAVISVIISPDKRTALGELKAFFVDPLLVWWMVMSYLDTKGLKWIIYGLVGSSLIVSGHAIYQKIIGNVTPDGRVIGLFGYSPNYLALFLAPIAIVIISYFFAEKKLLQPKSRTFENIFYIIVAILNITSLYLSQSRGGLLALLGGIIFYFILKNWFKIKYNLWLKIGLGLFLIISIISVAWLFRPDFSLRGDVPSRVISSNNVRWQIWDASLKLGRLNPVFGVGLGNFQNAFIGMTKDWVNFDAYINPWALSPHNLFLMFWLSTGIIGLIGLLAVLLVSFGQGLKNFSPFSIIFLSGLAVIIFQGLIDTPYFKNDLSLIFWLMIAGITISSKK